MGSLVSDLIAEIIGNYGCKIRRATLLWGCDPDATWPHTFEHMGSTN